VVDLKGVVRTLLKEIDVMGDAHYDEAFGDNRLCECGHTYYRHFDTYEGMSPVGCKYCCCEEGYRDTGKKETWDADNKKKIISDYVEKTEKNEEKV